MTAPRPSRVPALFAALLALIVLALTAAPAAAAVPGTTTPGQVTPSRALDIEEGGTGGRGICATESLNINTSSLPVNRWSDGMSFHSRLKASDWVTSASGIQRQGVLEMGLAVGNTIWSSAAGMVEFATAFCVIDSVGGSIDKAAARIGKALLNSGIIAGIVVATVIVYMWRVGRGAGSQAGSTLFKKAMVLGLFGIMIAGAAQSTGGGAKGSTAAYQPGVGSPGWFVTSVDQTVSSLAGTVASSLSTKSISGAEKVGPGGPLSCRAYVGALKDRYEILYGGQTYQQAAGVPLLLSSMWEQTGLAAWKKAQFGTRNTHGDYMYCRMLEYTSGQTAEDQIKVLDYVDNADGAADAAATDSLAFASSSDNKKRDRAWVAWAACSYGNGNWSIRDAALVERHGATAADCEDFFTGADTSGDPFDWDDSDDDITQTTDNAEARDFLLTLHGNKNAGGMVSMFIYVLSAALMWVVFGLFAGAIIVAKVAALVMMLLVFFALTVSLLPNHNSGKVGDYAKQYVGISLFAFGAQFLLSVLSVFTSILVDVGTYTMPGGAGGVMSMLWTGFAPLIALLVMHMGFKKMRVPSPVSVSSGLGWGKAMAGGAAAGAAGGGVASLMNRGQAKAKAAVKNRSRKTLDKTLPNRKGERVNTQAPKDTTPGRPAETTPAGTSGSDAPESGPQTPAGAGAPGGSKGPDLAEMDRQGASTKEKAAASRTAREDRKAAAEWGKTREGAAATAAAVDKAKAAQGTRRQRAADQVAVAREQFRQKPFQATKSLAGAGARRAGSVAKTAAVVGVGAATLGPLGAGVAYAGWKAAQAGNRRIGATESAEVEAYTEHRRAQHEQAQQAAAAAEQAQQERLGQAYANANKSRQGEPVENGQTFREGFDASGETAPDPSGWRFLDRAPGDRPDSIPAPTGGQGRRVQDTQGDWFDVDDSPVLGRPAQPTLSPRTQGAGVGAADRGQM